MRAQAEWKVITHMARIARPTSSSTRSRISDAALLVKVIARVLPDPAPARISIGPSPWVTASRCGGFRPSRRSSMEASAGMVALWTLAPLEDGPGEVASRGGVRLTDDIRAAAARVAASARAVRIDDGAIGEY